MLTESRYEFTDQGPATGPENSLSYKPGKYGATQSSKLRERPRAVLKREDDHLDHRDRDKLQSATMDEHRNFAIAGWMTRKHQDFIATTNFDCTSDSKALDDDIEGLVAEWSEPEVFDIRGRMGLQDHVRTSEACAVTAGDMLIEKLSSGHVQAIEADRIRNPKKPKVDRWINGVLQNRMGRNTHYAIHRRTKNGQFELEKILQAIKVYHFGYFQRFDQARGISLFAPGLDSIRQTGNTIRYIQAKQLLATIFGLIVKREDPEGGEVDLTNGPFMTEIGLDESVETLDDRTPSTETSNFLQHVIGMAMKALDLPFNFYDEAHTNFFGSRAALNLYLMSCLAKRRRVQALLKHLTKWRLNFEISQGNLRLPRSMTLDTIYRKYCNWIPVGVQWFNPAQEASAAEKLIALRLRSRSEIRRETSGDSWFSLQDQIDAEEMRIAQSAVDVTNTQIRETANLSLSDNDVQRVAHAVVELMEMAA